MAKIKVLENSDVKLGKGTLTDEAMGLVFKAKHVTGKTSQGGDLHLYTAVNTETIGIFNLEEVNGGDASNYIANLTKYGREYYIRLFTSAGVVVRTAEVKYSFKAYYI